jgi:16S rRNA (guanine527-N7)-methyltransferase
VKHLRRAEPPVSRETPGAKAARQRAESLGIALGDEAWNRLGLQVETLQKWQTKINLVAKSTLPDIWHRHVLDSLQLLPLLPADAKRVVDLGSGAGFPGLVLAIARPDLDVILIEADQRKSAFLLEAARIAGIPVRVVTGRLEKVPPTPADVVTARALAPLSKLLEWAAKFQHGHTICLFHKGEGLDNELTEASQHWMMDLDRVPSVTAPGAAIVRVARLRPRR